MRVRNGPYGCESSFSAFRPSGRAKCLPAATAKLISLSLPGNPCAVTITKNDRMIKALFLDIDGTLVSFETHRVGEPTRNALAEARRPGPAALHSHRPPPLRPEQSGGPRLRRLRDAQRAVLLRRAGRDLLPQHRSERHPHGGRTDRKGAFSVPVHRGGPDVHQLRRRQFPGRAATAQLRRSARREPRPGPCVPISSSSCRSSAPSASRG